MDRIALLVLLCILSVVVAEGQVTPIRTNSPMERVLKGGESHVYQLPLRPGEYARVTVEQRSSNAQLRLLTSDGAEVFRVDETRDGDAVTARRLTQEAAALYQRRDSASLRQAVAQAQQAVTLAQRAGEDALAGAALSLTGLCYRLLDEYPAAHQMLAAALEIQRRLGDRQAIADTLLHVGQLHAHSGKYQEALDCFYEANQLTQAADAAESQLAGFDLLGITYKYIGAFDKGALVYQQMLDQAEKLPDAAARDRYKTLALIGLGNVARASQQWLRSADYFLKALAEARRLGDPLMEASVRGNLGITWRRKGDWAKAVDYLEPALAQYLALGSRRGEAEMRYELACAYAGLGREDAARVSFNQAVALMKALGLRRERGLLHKDFAQFEARRGNLRAALAQLEQALPIASEQSKQLLDPDLRALFNGSRHHYYDDYVDLLMQLRDKEKSEEFAALAFHASERARARTLLDLLNERTIQGLDAANAPLAERARELERQIAAKSGDSTEHLSGAWTLLLAEYEQVRAQIRQRNPHYAALTQPEPLTLAAAQQQVLAGDALLLEYYLGAQRSYLFVVGKTSLHTFVLPPRAELEKAARDLHALLVAFSRPPVFRSIAEKQAWQQEQTRAQQTAAARLSQLLLAPAQALLAGQRLLIVPDGVLHYVPFAALPVVNRSSSVATRQRPNNGQRTTDSGQPLIVHHEILTLPSASTLAVLRRTSAGYAVAPATLRLFADPVFDKYDERVSGPFARGADTVATRLFRLPASRREAEAIAALVSPTQSKLALDFAAARASILSEDLSQYRYLHFATHGLLDNEHPELSALALSLVDRQGVAQNGFLRTMDVFKLKLNAELVVLSGCQTALGKEVNGEGLIGLTRGFMYAGARRVLASLWQVNDEATAELMPQFYQGMLGGKKLAPAAALRAAQLAMLRNPRWQSLYYWAAFTVQGEW